ncbi:hypothetical protein V8C86DRAFT_2726073 [Haematococcus lacustris]
MVTHGVTCVALMPWCLVNPVWLVQLMCHQRHHAHVLSLSCHHHHTACALGQGVVGRHSASAQSESGMPRFVTH